MKRGSLFWHLQLLLLAFLLGGQTYAADKPNILLILTDDLGNNDIASWGDGSAPTPTLDKLSRESMRFRRHYTDSTCSPSRASLLTGQHPVSVGFQTNGLGLSNDLPTLPKSLKALGYRTAHVGKWHVGEALEYPEIAPGSQGFDYWLGFSNHFVLRGPGPDGQILQRQPTHIDPWLQEDGRPPVQHQGYLDDLLTDKAIELIKGSDGQPWFINLWLYSPHTPYQPSPIFKAQFPDTPEGHYLAVLRQLDHNVERLLATLQAREVADNTIVVFASDNGGVNQARDNNFPLIGKKATYLEGGVRSPMLIRWSGHYERADITNVTHIADLFPTLVTMAGGRPPAGLMGRDLGPLMRGKAQADPKAFFWASDAGILGMTYGAARFPERMSFYREPSGKVSSQAMTLAIGASGAAVSPPARATTTVHQASSEIVAWERRVRLLELDWHPAGTGTPAYLTGKDFQRAPVFGGYSLGMTLSAAAPTAISQTLLEQPDVWKVTLESDRRLKVRHGEVELYSPPVALSAACNALIASFDVQQAYTYPFASEAGSHFMLYLNGSVLIDSKRLLSRPAGARVLENPTFIGANPNGSHAYQGQVGRPVVVNKMLLPRQEGYGLTDLQGRLCPKSGEP